MVLIVMFDVYDPVLSGFLSHHLTNHPLKPCLKRAEQSLTLILKRRTNARRVLADFFYRPIG